MTENLLDVIGLFTSVVHRLTAQVESFIFEEQNLGQIVFIIDLISQKPDCSMKDIVNILTLTPSTATRHVDKLVELGLVNRNLSMDDRRSVVLFLTEKGEEASKKFIKHRMNILGPVLDSFSSKEQDILVRLLREIASRI